MEKELNGKKDNGAWLSKNGYAMDEVTSALQKAIRRGDEDLAGFWALEMLESGYWRYLFHRLGVIACEDIGVANPHAVLVVNAVREVIEAKIRDARAKGNRWMSAPREPIGFIILYLCRSSKSRMSDDFVCLIGDRRKEGWRPEVPGYAVDEHTKRGKDKIRQAARERGITIKKAQAEEFYLSGGLLNKPVEVGGTNWSKALFDRMELPFDNYRLKVEEQEP